MRRLWIIRINAAVRQYGLSYSKFMNALKKSEIEVNRKMLAELAVNEKEAFEVIVETAKAHGLNMYHYLWYLLEELPKTDSSEDIFAKYLPWNHEVKQNLEKLAKKLLEN